MMATRMFCELRTVKKLTEPPVVSGTAMTKNRTRRARKSHAQMLLRNRRTRCAGVRIPEDAADARATVSLEARSITAASSGDPGPVRLRTPAFRRDGRRETPVFWRVFAGEGEAALHKGQARITCPALDR